jgi:hypothetical protein
VTTPGDQDGGPTGTVHPITVGAAQMLRVRTVWVTPIAVSVVLVFLMTLFYVGSVVNPAGHLSGLPVLLADQDRGATVASQHVDIGAEVAAALKGSSTVSSRPRPHRSRGRSPSPPARRVRSTRPADGT